MKSALKKSVVSTSISLILASGMAAFAAHAADDVKLKATKTNVAFSDFTPTEYSTKGKPNIIVLTMDDLGYGQLPFDKGSFDPKTMENREVVDTYKIGIDKAIEAAQKSTPTLLSLMDEGVRFTNGYVAHGVSAVAEAVLPAAAPLTTVGCRTPPFLVPNRSDISPYAHPVHPVVPTGAVADSAPVRSHSVPLRTGRSVPAVYATVRSAP